jgi:hypothetical protein
MNPGRHGKNRIHGRQNRDGKITGGAARFARATMRADNAPAARDEDETATAVVAESRTPGKAGPRPLIQFTRLRLSRLLRSASRLERAHDTYCPA